MRVMLGHPAIPCLTKMRLPELDALANIVLRLVQRAAEGVIREIDSRPRDRVGEQGKDVLAQRVFGERAGTDCCNGFSEAHSFGASVREVSSSGKNVSSSAWRRKLAPDEPPVPGRKPMMRSTVLRWRKRQS